MKKILFVISQLDNGGAEKIFVNLVEFYSKENTVNIDVLVFKKDNYYEKRILENNINLIVIDKTELGFFKFLYKYYKYVKLNKPAKIVSFLSYTNIITYFIIFFTKVPYIVSERNHYNTQFNIGIKNKIVLFFLKFSYKKATNITSVSNKISDDIAKDFTIPREKIITIYNGLDFKKIDNMLQEKCDFNFQDNIKYIIGVGRLYPQKNFPLLIEAFLKIKKEIPNVELIILGEGPERKKLEEIIINSSFQSSIHLLGQKSNPYIYMKKADIFVLSSLYEGFPNVLIEAMYTTGTVISTDCNSGPNEIIHDGVNGLLVENNNLEDLSVALLKVLNSNSTKNKLFKNSKQDVLMYSKEIMLNKFKQAIDA